MNDVIEPHLLSSATLEAKKLLGARYVAYISNRIGNSNFYERKSRFLDTSYMIHAEI
jgi:hypothetical protein